MSLAAAEPGLPRLPREKGSFSFSTLFGFFLLGEEYFFRVSLGKTAVLKRRVVKKKYIYINLLAWLPAVALGGALAGFLSA